MKKNRAVSKRTRRRKGARSTNGRRTQNFVSSAPAGTNEFMQHYTRFKGEGQSLLIDACLPICEVVFRTAANAGIGTLSFNNPLGGTLPLFSTALGLTNCIGIAQNTGSGVATYPQVITPVEYITPVYDLIGSCFVRWRIENLVFHYTPQATTTANGRAVVAFADDPVHPVLWQDVRDVSNVLISGQNPSQTNLLALGDSMAFAPWLPWSLDVSDRCKQNELYTSFRLEVADAEATITPASVRGDTAGVLAALRQSGMGTLSCRTLTTEAADFVGGIIWMEASIRLIEFCPVALTIASAPAVSLKQRTLKKDTDCQRNGEECLESNPESTTLSDNSRIEPCGNGRSYLRTPRDGPSMEGFHELGSGSQTRPLESRQFARRI